MFYKYTTIIVYGTLFLFFIIFEYVVLSINYAKYQTYLKNCPYTLSNLDYNLNLERRCELYNINNNSRYSYQYICSYNSSSELMFTESTKKTYKKLTKDIKDNYVQCIPVKTLINNSVISLFNEHYKDKFYCSRTNLPSDYTFINNKYCNDKVRKNIIRYIFYPICYCQILYIEFLVFYLIIKKNIHYLNDIDNINQHINFYINSNNSTREDDKSNRNNNDYIPQRTRNIIINNKTEIPIKENINNYYKTKKINKSIDLDLISISNSNNILTNNINDINNK